MIDLRDTLLKLNETRRTVMRETTEKLLNEEQRKAVRFAMAGALHTLVKPVTMTDEVTEHKFGFLGLAREKMVNMADVLEGKSEGGCCCCGHEAQETVAGDTPAAEEVKAEAPETAVETEPTPEAKVTEPEAQESMGVMANLPIPDYDNMNAHDVLAIVRRMDPEDIPVLISYERANKNRQSVLNVMEKRLARSR